MFLPICSYFYFFKPFKISSEFFVLILKTITNCMILTFLSPDVAAVSLPVINHLSPIVTWYEKE